MIWGVQSKEGVVSVARDEDQARAWAEYPFRPGAIGGVGEVLVKLDSDEWEQAA